MIKQFHVNKIQGLLYFSGNIYILVTWSKVSGWMIVGKDHKEGHTVQGHAHEQPEIYRAGFSIPNIQEAVTNNLVLFVEEDYHKMLL